VIRTAALLLLLTLTGTPVAALACVGRCGAPAVTGSQSPCHDDEMAGEGLSLSASHGCSKVLLHTPFVIKPTQHSPDWPAGDATTQPARSWAADVGHGQLGHLRPRPADSPPIKHSSYVILRI
jgi:hypothetical protein